MKGKKYNNYFRRQFLFFFFSTNIQFLIYQIVHTCVNSYLVKFTHFVLPNLISHLLIHFYFFFFNFTNKFSQRIILHDFLGLNSNFLQVRWRLISILNAYIIFILTASIYPSQRLKENDIKAKPIVPRL